MLKRFSFRYLFALYVALISYICVFQIYPAYDDFTYYTSPKQGITILEAVMPDFIFWRPFDRLIGYVLGYAPFLFPWLNHAIIFAGHFSCAMILYSVIKKLTDDKICSMAGAFFFCLSPGILAPLTNTDFTGQILAMTAGIISSFFFIKADSEKKYGYYALWILFAFFSVLWKENGIAWFIAPVMLNVTYSFMKGENFISAVKHSLVFVLIGLAGMALYFAVRFYLLGSATLGGSGGRYSVNFSVIHIIRNYALIIGGAVTCLDSLAIFLKPRNIPVIIVTGTLSAVFLCYVLVRVYDIFRNKRRVFWGLVLLMMCAGYISSPYAVMGHTSESTSYEMIFMTGLMLGIIFSSSRRPSYSGSVMAAMFACMILSSAHKLYVMHCYTLKVHNYLEEHARYFRNIPRKAFVYFIEDIPYEGFSVYKATLGHGLSGGSAFNSVWEWKTDITQQKVKSEDDIDFTPDSLPEYDTVFSLTQSGILKVLRN